MEYFYFLRHPLSVSSRNAATHMNCTHSHFIRFGGNAFRRVVLSACLAIGVCRGADAAPKEPEKNRENTGELPASVVFARVAPSVVVIRCQSKERQLQGSGVVVGSDEVITNYHVVEVHPSIPWAADAA